MKMAKKARLNRPSSGLSQLLRGQNGMGEDFPPKFLKIRMRDRMMRQSPNPKGRKPGPGCLNLPIERRVEPQTAITPMAKRQTPEMRFHFSIFVMPPL